MRYFLWKIYNYFKYWFSIVFNNIITFIQKFINTKDYTNKYYIYKNYSIWDYTYWRPIIHTFPNQWKLTIGKFCSIAPNVEILLWNWNHNSKWISTYNFWYKTDYSEWKLLDVTIWNDVRIWRNVVIMPWVSIGDWAIIALWSIVTKDVAPYTVVWWVPAKKIKNRFSEENVSFLIKLQRWNWDIKKIKKIIPLLLSNNFDSLKKISNAKLD